MFECGIAPPALQVFECTVSLPELVYVAVFSLRVSKDTAAPKQKLQDSLPGTQHGSKLK